MENFYRKRQIKKNCTKCDYQSSIGILLRRHMIYAHKIACKSIFKCPNCFGIHETLKSLKSHRRKCTSKNLKDNIMLNGNENETISEFRSEIVEIEVINTLNTVLEDSQNKRCTLLPDCRNSSTEDKIKSQLPEELVHGRAFVCCKCNNVYESHNEWMEHTKIDNCLGIDKSLNDGKKIFGYQLKLLQVRIDRLDMDTVKLSKSMSHVASKRNRNPSISPVLKIKNCNRAVKNKRSSQNTRKKYSLRIRRNNKNKNLIQVKHGQTFLHKNKRNVKANFKLSLRRSVKNRLPCSDPVKNQFSSVFKSRYRSGSRLKNINSHSIAEKKYSVAQTKVSLKEKKPIPAEKKSLGKKMPVRQKKSFGKKVPVKEKTFIDEKMPVEEKKSLDEKKPVGEKETSLAHHKVTSSRLKSIASPSDTKKRRRKSVPFLSQRNLSAKNKIFGCPYCNKAYSHQPNVINHITAYHRNPLSHKCNLCDIGFNQKVSCNNHILRWHTNIRLFECSNCDYGTNFKLNLLTHLPRCKVEDKKFLKGSKSTQSAKMKNNNEREYPCSMCDFVSANISDLVTHVNSHSKADQKNIIIEETESSSQHLQRLIVKKQQDMVKIKSSPVKVPPSTRSGKRSNPENINPKMNLNARRSQTNMQNFKRNSTTNNFHRTKSKGKNPKNEGFINCSRKLDSVESKGYENSISNSKDQVQSATDSSDSSLLPCATVITDEIRTAVAKALSILDLAKNTEASVDKHQCKLCSIYCLSEIALNGHMKRHC